MADSSTLVPLQEGRHAWQERAGDTASRPAAPAALERRLALALGAAIGVLFMLREMSVAGNVMYGSYASDSDEGIYAISAQLLLHGHALFRDVFSSQPAFFLPGLAAVQKLAGDVILGSHLFQVLSALVVLAAVFCIAWQVYRPLAGPLAAALLALSPGFQLYGHAVVAETPMLGLCALAVAATQAYYLRPRRKPLVLAGLLLMAGTEMKLLSVLMLPPIILMMAAGARRSMLNGRPRTALAIDAVAFLLCLCAPPLLVLRLVAPDAQWQQVVSFHLAAARAFPLDLAQNWDHVAGFLWRFDPALLVFGPLAAALALSWLDTRQRFLAIVHGLWLVAALGWLLTYHPLAQHQFAVLLLPLALLGASAVTAWRPHFSRTPTVEHARGSKSRLRSAGVLARDGRPGRTRISVLQGWFRGAVGIAAVGYVAVLVVHTWPLDGTLFTAAQPPRRLALIRQIERLTGPNDFVVCDEPMLALGAHRLMPPGLEDLSVVRTTSGFLTAAGAIAATRRYHPTAIVISHPAQASLPRGYLAWVVRHYRRVPSPVAGTQIYLRIGLRR
jgi:hypothetical protein